MTPSSGPTMKTAQKSDFAERSRTVVRIALGHMESRERSLREQSARLLDEANRAKRKMDWLAAVQYDDNRDVFTTPDGSVAAASVRVDGSAWPLMQQWYDAHPEERADVR